MKTFELELNKFIEWVDSRIKHLTLEVKNSKEVIKESTDRPSFLKKVIEDLELSECHLQQFKEVKDTYNIALEKSDFSWFCAEVHLYLDRSLVRGITSLNNHELKFSQDLSKKWLDVACAAFNQKH